MSETGPAEVLVRAAHLVQHLFADASREHDLTPSQARLLCVLTEGPVGMTELSRVLHLEKSSLTGLVDRIERRGLVERGYDRRDRRACQIALTSEGGKLAREVHHGVVTLLEVRLGDFEPADRTRLVTLLTRFTG